RGAVLPVLGVGDVDRLEVLDVAFRVSLHDAAQYWLVSQFSGAHRLAGVKPGTVSVQGPNSQHEVYEVLHVLGSHQKFMDHFLVDWQLSGPPRGVGSTANVRLKGRGEDEATDFIVLEADPSHRIMEESTGGPGGSRRLRGTYRLDELPSGGTRINFEL